MAITYEPIATTTLGSAAASVTFSSISGSYTDLVIIATLQTSNTVNMNIRFNSDSGSNYSNTSLAGNGTVAASGRDTNATESKIDYYAAASNTAKQYIINIPSYANTSVYKNHLTRGSLPSGEAVAMVGLWRNTNAITSITILPGNGNMNTGSTFTLYGIASA
jgi:hypothetical protein